MRPPPHLSCPSSSASAYASSYVRQYVHIALASAGFSRSSGQAVDLLTEVLERYLLLVGSVAQQHANHVGRTKPCAWDAESALRELGSSSESIQDWLFEDGAELAGQWHSSETDESEVKYAAGVRALQEYNERAKVPACDRERPLQLIYDTVAPEQIELVEQLMRQDALDEEEMRSADSSPLRTPPPLTNGNGFTRKRRRSSGSIVPSFLPDLPSPFGNRESHATQSNGVVQDAESIRDAALRKIKVDEEARAISDVQPIESEPPLTAEDAKVATVIDDIQQQPSRSVEDLWHNAVPFATSTAAQGRADVTDTPAISDDHLRHNGVLSEDAPTSSMRAFANDYRVLVQESRNSAPGFLTPSGGAYARVFHQRRAVAAFLTDSSKYVPCDTIFGSIGARPTELPFQPTSSMLVTPPTSHNPAPTFTPLRPNGRDLPSTTVVNNALYPACRHRNPSNMLNAARLVSGGIGTETYRRMTRIHDPDPILDEQHAERVFHGQPVPKELLIEGNSFLKAALDVLKIKRAEERAAARGVGVGGDGDVSIRQVDMYGGHTGNQNGAEQDGDASQLSMSATRDRIKVKSGTVVSTWDWLTREYNDAVLPGKRFRAATPGVTLGGGAAADTTATPGVEDAFRHRRSESVAGTPKAS